MFAKKDLLHSVAMGERKKIGKHVAFKFQKN